MYYVIGENKSGEFEAWEYLTASQAMAIRNDYLTHCHGHPLRQMQLAKR